MDVDERRKLHRVETKCLADFIFSNVIDCRNINPDIVWAPLYNLHPVVTLTTQVHATLYIEAHFSFLSFWKALNMPILFTWAHVQ